MSLVPDRAISPTPHYYVIRGDPAVTREGLNAALTSLNRPAAGG